MPPDLVATLDAPPTEGLGVYLVGKLAYGAVEAGVSDALPAALIRRMHEAKLKGAPQVTIWAGGEMTRRVRKTMPGVVATVNGDRITMQPSAR